ncbi:hypothetical protein ACUN8C_01570 [Kushneria sp. Sum13]|uniref:hypothetical protein n=1 Tax=Kushneria sp. Sum13 TaxID=3459196 RepID=UPI0040460C47
MSHEQQQATGATMAPQGMPEDIRLTLLAAVTEQMIRVRRRPQGVVSTYELSRLIPAAEWLTNDTEGDAGAKH